MKKLKVITGLLLAAVLLASVSCGAAMVGEEYEGEMEVVVEEAGSSGYPAPVVIDREKGEWSIAEDEETVQSPYEPDSSLYADIDRMIVRTGNVMLVVNDVPIAIDEITALADGSGGYVVSSRVWKSGERLVGSISFRVPAEYFSEAIETLRELAVDVTSESTSSKDVTEEYVDLTAKLKNLEATEQQLLAILEKAETVEDILNVQTELSKTRGEIEQTKGRMQYLERTSATSLIEVYLEQSKLDIEFVADKRRGLKEGEKVRFIISEIAGGFPPYNYEWDFGDGEISTEASPTHAYVDDGIYTVSLTVTDDQGNTDTETRDDYISVVPGWSAGSVASNAWNGLAVFGRAMANLFIWIGVFFPLWIVIGGIIFGIIYWRRRRRKHSQSSVENQKQGSD